MVPAEGTKISRNLEKHTKNVNSHLRREARDRGIKCRHCVRLYAGACPYPGSRSVHRMHISSGACELATLDPRFRHLYRDVATCSPLFGPAGSGKRPAG